MGNAIGLAARHPGIAVLMLAAILAEYVWRRRSRGYDLRALGASVGVFAGQLLLRPLTALVMGMIFAALVPASLFHLSPADWRTWAGGFLAVEFAYYWFHRASHRLRWMWATHSVHHSATELVLPAAYRLGWTEFFSLGWLFFAALVLIGFPPTVIAALLAINLTYQFPLHTEAIGRLGPLEWVFNTPSHHRAHHSRDAAWLDCNFGGVLIVFDRMFGTFRAEPLGGGLHYGLAGREPETNPVRIAIGEWRRMFVDIGRAKGLAAKIAVALGAP